MYKEIVLKSVKPEEYGDEVVTCRVIENADVNAYLATIPEERRHQATKVAPVEARRGEEGEVIHTVLLTERNGRTYIIHEEDGTVKRREVEGEEMTDVVVTNVHSTSNEQYVVRADKFIKMYVPNEDGTFTPQPDERELVQVDEDIIIKTAWGSDAVCLKGSYIVIYNAEENDFNTIEQGAMKSTYKVSTPKQKKLS
jgi:hypothetical protein